MERCDDPQRTVIVDIIAPEFLKICLNMHGTRAVQKLIEFLSTKRQVNTLYTQFIYVYIKKGEGRVYKRVREKERETEIWECLLIIFYFNIIYRFKQ